MYKTYYRLHCFYVYFVGGGLTVDSSNDVLLLLFLLQVFF